MEAIDIAKDLARTLNKLEMLRLKFYAAKRKIKQLEDPEGTRASNTARVRKYRQSNRERSRSYMRSYMRKYRSKNVIQTSHDINGRNTE